jgi:hypothetical protein
MAPDTARTAVLSRWAWQAADDFSRLTRTAAGFSAHATDMSPGYVAHEESFYEALSERRIAAAALDVWYRYPDLTSATLRERGLRERPACVI